MIHGSMIHGTWYQLIPCIMDPCIMDAYHDTRYRGRSGARSGPLRSTLRHGTAAWCQTALRGTLRPCPPRIHQGSDPPRRSESCPARIHDAVVRAIRRSTALGRDPGPHPPRRISCCRGLRRRPHRRGAALVLALGRRGAGSGVWEAQPAAAHAAVPSHTDSHTGGAATQRHLLLEAAQRTHTHTTHTDTHTGGAKGRGGHGRLELHRYAAQRHLLFEAALAVPGRVQLYLQRVSAQHTLTCSLMHLPHVALPGPCYLAHAIASPASRCAIAERDQLGPAAPLRPVDSALSHPILSAAPIVHHPRPRRPRSAPHLCLTRPLSAGDWRGKFRAAALSRASSPRLLPAPPHDLRRGRTRPFLARSMNAYGLCTLARNGLASIPGAAVPVIKQQSVATRPAACAFDRSWPPPTARAASVQPASDAASGDFLGHKQRQQAVRHAAMVHLAHAIATWPMRSWSLRYTRSLRHAAIVHLAHAIATWPMRSWSLRYTRSLRRAAIVHLLTACGATAA